MLRDPRPRNDQDEEGQKSDQLKFCHIFSPPDCHFHYFFSFSSSTLCVFMNKWSTHSLNTIYILAHHARSTFLHSTFNKYLETTKIHAFIASNEFKGDRRKTARAPQHDAKLLTCVASAQTQLVSSLFLSPSLSISVSPSPFSLFLSFSVAFFPLSMCGYILRIVRLTHHEHIFYTTIRGAFALSLRLALRDLRLLVHWLVWKIAIKIKHLIFSVLDTKGACTVRSLSKIWWIKIRKMGRKLWKKPERK